MKQRFFHRALFAPTLLAVWLFLPFLFAACTGKRGKLPMDQKIKDSIIALLDSGKNLRNESQFEEALRLHNLCAQLAESYNDTLNFVKALNNIGTDYRRMGVLDEAQLYHYKAWKISEASTDTSQTARKNRVVSLNGLGNIYMTLGNYERADSVLRRALKGETELGSATGQAINYANLGSIFQHRGQLDSAWVYYRKSMQLNQATHNTLGISLCHTYFGSLYEKAREYDKATAEYQQAYQLMNESKDDWHALNSLIALAGIYQATHNTPKVQEYLNKAETMAKGIESEEHLEEIYTLYYRLYKNQGNYQLALKYHEQAASMKDSVMDMDKVNRIQNATLKIERSRQDKELNLVNERFTTERTEKYIGFTILLLFIILSGAIICLLLYTQRVRAKSHQALKKVSQMRETFFTNITHELRTPLTVLLGLSHDIAHDEKATSDITEKAIIIERQGNSLLTLINQLLDIAKIKTSLGNADWRRGNICAHIEMIMESYGDYAKSRNIRMQYTTREPIEMDFVPDYVNKVMNNLLSNALKFTPEYGKITTAVWRDNDNQLVIEVSDTGKGIPTAALEHIFEPFYQAQTDVQATGTGIGLALVHQIVKAVEGTISVESKLGQGTTFCIRIPIIHHTEEAILSLASNKPEKEKDFKPTLPEKEMELEDNTDNGNEKRLLIIEDNKDVAAYMGNIFKEKYAVAYANNGKEGLEKASSLIPDLIITDLMMPEMDGLEVCRSIRADEAVNHIPIIVVTAKVTEEEQVEGLKAGADTYLTKPFNSEVLQTSVEKLLEGRRMLRKKYSAIPEAVLNNERPQTVLPKAGIIGTTQRENKTYAEEQAEKVNRRFLNRVANYVYQKLERQQKIEIPALAQHLCLSYSQFNRKMTAITGLTPQGYVTRMKVQKAKELMEKHPEYSYLYISELCGFSDYSNFVRAFKSVYGVSPKQSQKE